MNMESPQKFDLRKTKDKDQLIQNLLKQLAENLFSKGNYPEPLSREDFGDLLPRLIPELFNIEDATSYKLDIGSENDFSKGVRIIVFNKNDQIIDVREWPDIVVHREDQTPKIIATIKKEIKKLNFGEKREISLQVDNLSHELYQSLLDLTDKQMLHDWVSSIKIKITTNNYLIELYNDDNQLKDAYEFPLNV